MLDELPELYSYIYKLLGLEMNGITHPRVNNTFYNTFFGGYLWADVKHVCASINSSLVQRVGWGIG